MPNLHFQQKIASEELSDTILFSCGSRPLRMRNSLERTLSIADTIDVRVASFKSILVNGLKYTSVYKAKLAIMKVLL